MGLTEWKRRCNTNTVATNQNNKNHEPALACLDMENLQILHTSGQQWILVAFQGLYVRKDPSWRSKFLQELIMFLMLNQHAMYPRQQFSPALPAPVLICENCIDIINITKDVDQLYQRLSKQSSTNKYKTSIPGIFIIKQLKPIKQLFTPKQICAHEIMLNVWWCCRQSKSQFKELSS